MDVRQRKKGIVMSLEDIHELGSCNLGFQTESIGTKNPLESCEDAHSVCTHFKVDMSALEKTENNRKVSFPVGKRGSERLEEDEYSIAVTWDAKPSSRKGSILDEHLDCVTCESEPPRSSKKRRPKTMKDWLVNPHLYKVSSLNVAHKDFQHFLALTI